MSHITQTDLDCGAVLLVEEMDSVASVAISWLLPPGAASDPDDGDGHAALLSELIFRGAGKLNSKEHSDALDRFGIQRSSNVQTHHLSLSAVMLGDRLSDGLPLLISMVREPALDAAALDPVRSLCLQSLASIDDDPRQLAMLTLNEQHFSPPLNRHGYGKENVLTGTPIETLRNAWQKRCVPHGSIISVAGSVDAQSLADQLNQQLDGWSGTQQDTPHAESPARGYRHVTQETAQVHIGIACDAPPEAHEDSLLERLGISVLGGSTSGRLFTEVREKRSLCYSVGASYRASRDYGAVVIYAGTTPDRAQETLDVCGEEMQRLHEGVEADEFQRAVAGLKSRLIMQGESSAARASALGADQFRLGYPRSLDEIARKIDSITLDQLNDYLSLRAFPNPTVVSLGPVELNLPATIQSS